MPSGVITNKTRILYLLLPWNSNEFARRKQWPTLEYDQRNFTSWRRRVNEKNVKELKFQVTSGILLVWEYSQLGHVCFSAILILLRAFHDFSIPKWQSATGCCYWWLASTPSYYKLWPQLFVGIRILTFSATAKMTGQFFSIFYVATIWTNRILFFFCYHRYGGTTPFFFCFSFCKHWLI